VGEVSNIGIRDGIVEKTLAADGLADGDSLLSLRGTFRAGSLSISSRPQILRPRPTQRLPR
jgi:hypothetical protein